MEEYLKKISINLSVLKKITFNGKKEKKRKIT
jgi:hypothetical protein